MQICIATDKFKGSLTAFEAADAIAAGFNGILDHPEISIVPMADGGDGSLSILERVVDGRKLSVPTFDARMREIEAPLFLFEEGRSAFIESATVCGLAMLERKDRCPEKATSYGLGVMIRRALEEGVKNIYIGLGGTATNDGGAGMMTALGCRYLDTGGHPVEAGCLGLAALATIDDSSLDRRFIAAKVYAVTDVGNPLLGKEGATYTYALQKGTSRMALPAMETAMCRLAQIYEGKYGKRMDLIAGGGAAGGIGAMLLSMHRGFRIEGWRLFAQLQHLEERISQSDLVITGEGRFDMQSLSGKVIDGVEELCRKHSKPLWVFCGKSQVRPEELAVCPSIEQVFRISDIEMDPALSIRYADRLLRDLAMLAARTL